jgi:hypothetical protein
LERDNNTASVLAYSLYSSLCFMMHASITWREALRAMLMMVCDCLLGRSRKWRRWHWR